MLPSYFEAGELGENGKRWIYIILQVNIYNSCGFVHVLARSFIRGSFQSYSVSPLGLINFAKGIHKHLIFFFTLYLSPPPRAQFSCLLVRPLVSLLLLVSHNTSSHPDNWMAPACPVLMENSIGKDERLTCIWCYPDLHYTDCPRMHPCHHSFEANCASWFMYSLCHISVFPPLRSDSLFMISRTGPLSAKDPDDWIPGMVCEWFSPSIYLLTETQKIKPCA